ncbi:MAG: protein phosphatase 2C domain-containing protein [Ferruginibacter sp.]
MGEKYFGLTDPGRQRENNEDSFIAQTVFNDNFIVACVIDGVGGYAGGEIAAQLTRDEILDHLDKMPVNIIDHMVSSLENANERIIREKEVSPQNEKMACVVTLAMVDLEKNIFYFAHVGDTRLYLFRDGSLIKVTRDHSTVGFLEESGRLTEEAAMQHPKRNEVNKALGYETQKGLTKDFIDKGESAFLPGDTILICSDGLTDMIPASKIISILNDEDDLAAKCVSLVNAANDAGGKDNVTVVLVRNDKSPILHTVTKPPLVVKKNNDNGDAAVKIAELVTGNNEPVIIEGKKRKSGINKLLLFFCVVFFLGLIWMLFQNYKTNDEAENPPPQTIVTKQRNAAELNLIDSINAASISKVVRVPAGQSILVTDSIFIKNDSLHIIGNGSAVVRDSAYSGPAFILASTCKYILLDSLTIDNFNVGILVLNKGLHLKNIRFKNCVVPLQFQQHLIQDTLVSGAQAESIFNQTDTVRRR